MSGYIAKRRTETKHVTNPLIHVAVFAASGMILLTALLFFSAFLALQKDWSGKILTVSAYICCAVSAFLCGFFCAKTAANRKALFGIVSSLPMLLLLAVFCFAFYGKVGSGFAVCSILIPLCAALGSVLTVRRKKTKRKYKKIGAVR